MIAATLRLEPTPVEHPSAAAIGRALRDYRFAAGLGLMALASLVFGILSVLGPLRLSAAGWGAAAIGAIWLVGAALEAVGSMLVGRLIDRRGQAATGPRRRSPAAQRSSSVSPPAGAGDLRAADRHSARRRSACSSRPRSP